MTHRNQAIAQVSASQICTFDDILDTMAPVNPRIYAPQAECARLSIPDIRLRAGSLCGDAINLGLPIGASIPQPLPDNSPRWRWSARSSRSSSRGSNIRGLERFSFRIEDTFAIGSVSSDHLEQKPCRFWGIAIAVDLERLSALK